MQQSKRELYWSRADANALGGFLEEPFQAVIPTLAPASLPVVGGIATGRSEAFNFHEIVSCSAAYTRVSGTQHGDGSVAILATAVVEDLNILEVVTAERIVAQLSISIAKAGGTPEISFTGTCFEGLKLAGCDARPRINPGLLQPAGGTSSGSSSVLSGGRRLRCWLVDGFEGENATGDRGWVREIPDFGKFIFGQVSVLIEPPYTSVQLVALRAELGCAVGGQISVCAGGGGGTGDN
jgi:hypothetical protein